MMKIAIIAPCILPVPASRGGAVEVLISKLIDANEEHKKFSIDLFTIDHDEKPNYSFASTNLIYIKTCGYAKAVDRVLDKYYRTVPSSSATRLLDASIQKAFFNRLSELSYGYDAVIIENMMSTACEIVRKCKGEYGFSVYFHMHNDVDIYRTPEYIRELVRNGVQFIAVSGYIKKQILKYASDATVHLLYNGVDLSEYRADVRSNDGVSFLYAGRIIPDKGVKELATAFNMFIDGIESSEKQKYSMEIVGFSGFDNRYESEVRSLSERNKQISLYEQVSGRELVKRYDSADIVVIPSMFEEPFGLVALESMAMGKVIIASDSGALPEVLGDAAIIVDKSKEFSKHLCEAMREAAMDEKLRDKLAESAYNRARQIKDFDISFYYSNFRRIIDRGKPEGRISVIVPVYNVETYLPNCVESLISQTYSNIEIILVNDGSTDSSGMLCRKYADKDTRIKIVEQENQGLSVARNTGCDIATGDYIFFCDSDDHIKSDTFEKMVNKMFADNSDVVACGIDRVWYGKSGEIIRQKPFTNALPGKWSGRESLVQMMSNNNICTVAWNKLYKKRIFDNIRFNAGVLHEDEAVVYKLLYRAGIVSYMPESLYLYRQRSGSIMQDDMEKRYKDLIRAIQDRTTFFESHGEHELVQQSRASLLNHIKYIYRNIEDKQKKKELSELYREELHSGGIPDVGGLKKKISLLAWEFIKY